MKKNIITMVAIALTLSWAVAASAKDFKVVGSWSSLSLYKNFEVPFWTEEFPKAVGGGIKVNMTSFDQMGMKGGEVFRLLGMKLFDVGSTVANYAVSDSSALEGLDLPAIAPDIQQAQKVVESFKPVLDDVMQTTFKAKLLGVTPYPAQVLFCNKEIKGLNDLKGKKIRASGRALAEFIESLGATGVTLAFSEVPQSLQRGVVDCAVTGSLSGYSAGWGEVSTHLYPLPLGGWAHVVSAMSLSNWETFDKKTQEKILTAVQEKLEAPVWKAVDYETQQGVNCLTGAGTCDFGKPNAMKLVPFTKEDIAISSKILKEDVLPKWASRTDKKWVIGWNDTVGKVVGIQAPAK